MLSSPTLSFLIYKMGHGQIALLIGFLGKRSGIINVKYLVCHLVQSKCSIALNFAIVFMTLLKLCGS